MILVTDAANEGRIWVASKRQGHFRSHRECNAKVATDAIWHRKVGVSSNSFLATKWRGAARGMFHVIYDAININMPQRLATWHNNSLLTQSIKVSTVIFISWSVSLQSLSPLPPPYQT